MSTQSKTPFQCESNFVFGAPYETFQIDKQLSSYDMILPVPRTIQYLGIYVYSSGYYGGTDIRTRDDHFLDDNGNTIINRPDPAGGTYYKLTTQNKFIADTDHFLSNHLTKASRAIALRAIYVCAKKYGFNHETAIHELGIRSSYVRRLPLPSLEHRESPTLPSPEMVTEEDSKFENNIEPNGFLGFTNKRKRNNETNHDDHSRALEELASDFVANDHVISSKEIPDVIVELDSSKGHQDPPQITIDPHDFKYAEFMWEPSKYDSEVRELIEVILAIKG